MHKITPRIILSYLTEVDPGRIKSGCEGSCLTELDPDRIKSGCEGSYLIGVDPGRIKSGCERLLLVHRTASGIRDCDAIHSRVTYVIACHWAVASWSEM